MEERGDAEEGEERGEADQQQPLLLPLLFCFPVSFCQLSFTGLVVLACTEVDVQKIRTYILPKPALASHVQHKHSGHAHTHKCMYAQCIHTHTHTFSCLFSWYSLPLSMQMTFIMQMYANQIQPSENQGWERKKNLDTDIE